MTTISKKSFITFLFAVLFACCFVLGITTTKEQAHAQEIDPNVSLAIESNNVAYADSVYILYAVSNEGFDRKDYDVKLLFWTELQDEYVYGTHEYEGQNKGKVNVNDKSCLVFYSNGLAAKEMTKDVYSRAYVEINGNAYYSEVSKFSVLEYVYTKLDNGGLDGKLQKLFEDMLNYGASAQDNFNYNTHRPANGKYYNVVVKGGTCPDGFKNGRYLSGEKIIITADAPEQGKRFSHWIDKNGIIVGYDPELEITVGENKKYEAIFKDSANVAAQLALTAEIAYDGTIADVDLPTAVQFDDDGTTVTLDVVWDTTPFVQNQVGEQTLYATLVDESAYAKYGIADGDVKITITTQAYTYKLDSTTGNYTLTGYYGTDETLTVPSTYKNTLVTTIASGTFNEVASLKNITVPRTITKIENGAFVYCDNIAEMTLPFIGETDHRYTNTYLGWIFGATSYSAQKSYLPLKLSKITLVDGAIHLGQNALNGCPNITTLILPDSLEYMGSGHLEGSGVKELNLPKNVKEIYGGIENVERLNIVDLDSYLNIWTQTGGITNTEAYFDLYCNGQLVTEVTMPRNTTIGYYVLRGCQSIKKLVIPNTVKDIWQHGFDDMYGLETVIFEEGSQITELGACFNYCEKLKTINVQALTKLEELYAFTGCSSLKDVTLPQGVKTIGGFNGTAIENIELPASVTTIYSNAFARTKLKTFTIPSTITALDRQVFSNCKELREVTLHDQIVSIGSSAFSGCVNLAKITIPANVETISSSAFANCYNLAQITILSQRLSAIESSAFEKCYNLHEIYNLSPLTFTAGSDEYGAIAKYAKVIHTSLEETALVNVDENGFITYDDGGEIAYLMGYAGEESKIILPEDINGKFYAITDYSFYNKANIYEVIISAGAIRVGYCAFSNEDIKKLVIGENVEYVDGFIVNNTIEQIVILTKKSTWDDRALYYTYGTNIPVFCYGTKNEFVRPSAGCKYYYVENAVDVPTDGGNYWHYGADGQIEIW